MVKTVIASGSKTSSVVWHQPPDLDPASNQGVHTRGKSETSTEVQSQALRPKQGGGYNHTQEKHNSTRAPAPALWP